MTFAILWTSHVAYVPRRLYSYSLGGSMSLCSVDWRMRGRACQGNAEIAIDQLGCSEASVMAEHAT